MTMCGNKNGNYNNNNNNNNNNDDDDDDDDDNGKDSVNYLNSFRIMVQLLS